MSQSIRGELFEQSSTSQRVITAVAETTGNDPTEVGPLYRVIDPDALDRLFDATPTNARAAGRVEFTFAGCDVVVHGNGAVEVAEIDAGADATEPSPADEGTGDAIAETSRSRADVDGAQ
jgi:hypothetical protein